MINRFLDIKDYMLKKQVLNVLSLSQYKPTLDKTKALAIKYINDCNTFCYGYGNIDNIIGIIVLEKQDLYYEILSIAVDKSHQQQGIGSKLIHNAIIKRNIKRLIAETDDDAVEFYKKNNFNIINLGVKYNNTVRYKCELIDK